MREHLCTHHAEFYYSNSRPHKCQTHNYVSTSAENDPAMAGPAGPVPAPMLFAYAEEENVEDVVMCCDVTPADDQNVIS